jgi:hypothetical protein
MYAIRVDNHVRSGIACTCVLINPSPPNFDIIIIDPTTESDVYIGSNSRNDGMQQLFYFRSIASSALVSNLLAAKLLLFDWV